MSRPSDLVVCLFSHPDDEFAIFAELETLASAGHRIVCLYLTDGAYGGQSAERRAAESRRVLQRLGVSPADVHFPGWALGIGDTKLHEHLPEAIDATRQLIGVPAGRVRLLMPAWEGGHHDHDATHLVGLAVARDWRDAEILQFSIYHGRAVPGPCFRVLSPIPENGPVLVRPVPWAARMRHLRFFLSYPSQWKTWLALLPLVAVNYLVVGAQRLQSVDPARVGEPPHPGTLLYERRGFCTWTEFAARTEPYRVGATPPRPGPERV